MKEFDYYFVESFKNNPTLDRAYMALEENNFLEAKALFDSVIVNEPRNALAYLGLFLCDRNAGSLDCLLSADDSEKEDPAYKRMLRFADDDIKRMLAEVETEKARLTTEKKYDGIYNSLIERYNKASTEEEYRTVAAELGKLNGYKLSGKIAEVARDRAEGLRKDKLYVKAEKKSQSRKPDDLIEAGKIYAALGGWKDSDAKLNDIRSKVTAVDNYYNMMVGTFNSTDTEEGFIEVAKKLRVLQGYKHSEQIAAEAEKRAKELEAARKAEEERLRREQEERERREREAELERQRKAEEERLRKEQEEKERL